MLLQVEVASFHPQRVVLSTTRHDSSLWPSSSPCGAWALPSTLLYGARTFLWQLKHLPATVWPASAAILPHRDTGGLTSGVPRRKNGRAVVFLKRRTGMRRRVYFLLPDLGSAIRTANDLLLARVEDRSMHFLAKRGMSLGELHEANALQKSDAVHGAE